MSATVRRLRLPADHRSPVVARAFVRDALAGGLDGTHDEVLLLTTEVLTNAVIHAGTDLDLSVAVDGSEVTVSVRDRLGGPFDAPKVRNPDELSEHGRGLLLVDRLASSWGTTHDIGGKTVWFRIETGPAMVREDLPDLEPAEAMPPPATAMPFAQACLWLSELPDRLREQLSVSRTVSELALRLCEVTGAGAADVWLDRGDGLGPQRLGGHGAAVIGGGVASVEGAEDGSKTLDVPLPLPLSMPLSRRLRGRLALRSIESGRLDAAAEVLARLSAQRIAIAIEAAEFRDADRQRRNWAAFLAEVGELLAQSLDIDLTLALVPRLVVPRLGVWCAVHLAEGTGLRLASATHADEGALPELHAALSATDPAGFAGRLPDALRTRSPVTLARPHEGIAVPLVARGRVLGTLAVGRPAGRLHDAETIAVIGDFARRASLAIDNARIQAERTTVSRELQAALLPVALPVVEGVEFAAEYVPVGAEADVGGDFYDVLELAGDRWLLTVGDVCGKGARAAAVTGVVRDVLRVLVRDGRSLPEAVRLLNRTLADQRDEDRYCTLAAAVMRRNPNGTLGVQLCLAGHDRPILLRPDGTMLPVGRFGDAVGVLDEVEVSVVELTLHRGEALVFFTDGVTERRSDGQMYGNGRLCSDLAGFAGMPAPLIAAGIRAAVLAFSATPPRDDLALLIVRNSG